jgi:hypothetical protein
VVNLKSRMAILYTRNFIPELVGENYDSSER